MPVPTTNGRELVDYAYEVSGDLDPDVGLWLRDRASRAWRLSWGSDGVSMTQEAADTLRDCIAEATISANPGVFRYLAEKQRAEFLAGPKVEEE